MEFQGLLHKHFIEQSVTDLGSPEPFFSPPHESIIKVVELLRDENCGSAIVINESDAIIGILTERDLITKLPLGKVDGYVQSFMTPEPEVIRKSGSVARALHMMSVGGFRHLPIVHKNSYVEGVLSVRDVITYIYSRMAADHDPSECETVAEHEQVKKYFCSPIEIFNPSPAPTIRSTCLIREAVEALQKSSSGGVLTVDEIGRVNGIFTDRDYLKKIACKGLDPDTPVSPYITTSVISITHDVTVANAYRLLSEGGYRHLPILTADGKAEALLSIKDFLDRLVHGMLMELEHTS